MEIELVTGKGRAATELSAFDNALYKCGIEDYNLLPLSSVIPPETELLDKGRYESPNKVGNPLYCVYSKNTTSEDGEICAAGIGWMNSKKGGILVEHHGGSEKEVKQKISDSLSEMKEYRDRDFTDKGSKIVSIECEDNPVAVVVAAIFEESEWKSNSVIEGGN